MPERPAARPCSLSTRRQKEWFVNKYLSHVNLDFIEMVVNERDEMIGFMIAMPSMSRAFQKARGRLFPFGIFRIKSGVKKLREYRLWGLGLVKEYRHNGIDVIMYRDFFRHGVKKGYNWGECSWILEDNFAIRKPLESFGARPYKTYRIYEGRSEGAAAP